MGRRRLELSDCFFSMMFGGQDHHYRVIDNELPQDTRIVNVRMKWPSTVGATAVEYLLESSEWEGPEEGKEIPVINPLFRWIGPEEKIGLPAKVVAMGSMQAIANNAKHLALALGLPEDFAAEQAKVFVDEVIRPTEEPATWRDREPLL